jgi:membrane-bound ClpP family serine protease
MTTRRASTRHVFARYLVAEAPGWIVLGVVLAVLVRVWDLGLPVAALLLGLWILKDLALFPVLRIAYEPGGGSGGAENLLGALAEATTPIAPEGWVRIGAERWRARVAGAAVARGATVRVKAVQGLELLVEAVPDDPA